jgi:NAD-dependent DNA ligase
MIAFTADSTCRIQGFQLDRQAAIMLAERAGLHVHPRITKKIQLLVDCDRSGVSINQSKAQEYGIPVVDELEFWMELGVPAERLDWRSLR